MTETTEKSPRACKFCGAPTPRRSKQPHPTKPWRYRAGNPGYERFCSPECRHFAREAELKRDQAA